jgi:hypothetical protein
VCIASTLASTSSPEMIFPMGRCSASHSGCALRQMKKMLPISFPMRVVRVTMEMVPGSWGTLEPAGTAWNCSGPPKSLLVGDPPRM